MQATLLHSETELRSVVDALAAKDDELRHMSEHMPRHMSKRTREHMPRHISKQIYRDVCVNARAKDAELAARDELLDVKQQRLTDTEEKLTSLSADRHQALADAERERDGALEEKRALDAQLGALRANASGAEQAALAQLEAANATSVDAHARLQAMESELGKVRRDGEAELEKALADVAAATAEAANAKTEAAALADASGTAHAQLQARGAELESVRAELASATAEAAKLKGGQQAEAEAAAEQLEAVAEKAALERGRADALAKKLELAQSDATDAAKLGAERAALSERVAELESRLDEASQAVRQLEVPTKIY